MEELKVLAGDAGNEAGDADAERDGQGEEARGDEGPGREGQRIGKADSLKLHPHPYPNPNPHPHPRAEYKGHPQPFSRYHNPINAAISDPFCVVFDYNTLQIRGATRPRPVFNRPGVAGAVL